MGSKIYCMMLPIVLVTLVSVDLASAAQKLKTTGSTIKPGRKIIILPLTEAECVGLGGKVLPVSNQCTSTQKICVTTDNNGVIHSSCVTQ